MPNDAKIEKLIRLLIRKTTEGEIEWDQTEPPNSLTEASNFVIHEYFASAYKEQDIAVYEAKFQNYDDDRGTYWSSTYCFAFITDNRAIWETWDREYPISTLFRVAKESAADVDNILNKLLD
jgi:hypothetical protein